MWDLLQSFMKIDDKLIRDLKAFNDSAAEPGAPSVNERLRSIILSTLQTATAADQKDFSVLFPLVMEVVRPLHDIDNKEATILCRTAFVSLFEFFETSVRGKSCTWGGRHDWCLHFVVGATLGSGLSSMIELAEGFAFMKEFFDSKTEGNVFDMTDYAATYYGIKWSSILSQQAHPASWFLLWSSAGTARLKCEIFRTLKKFEPGERPTDEQIEYARSIIDSEFKFYGNKTNML